MPGDARQIDPLLMRYFGADGGADSDRALADLLSEHVRPVVRQIIMSKLRVRFDAQDNCSSNPDAEDIYSETLLRIVARLRQSKAEDDAAPIGNLRSYAAVTSYHAVYEYLRARQPRRQSLKNRLRYYLSHQSGFGVWENESGELVAGLATWRGQSMRPAAARLQTLMDTPAAVLKEHACSGEPDVENLSRFVTAVFRYIQHPLPLDDLADVAAALFGIHEIFEHSADDEGRSDFIADQRQWDPAAELDHRAFLKSLWEEIRQLPLRQRIALLLNLRDEQGAGVACLLPATGVASIREMANALEMTAADFAGLWQRLPLDDAAIASMLGITRQQVINLRKCARERLARKIRPAAAKKIVREATNI